MRHQKTRREAALFALGATREKSMQLQGRGRAEILVGFNQSVCASAPPSVLPPAACLHPSAIDCTSSPFQNRRCRLPPARALLEFLLRGQIRAPAHTCLVRPDADLFLLAISSRSQRPSKKQKVDPLFWCTQHTLSAQYGTVITLHLLLGLISEKKYLAARHSKSDQPSCMS